MLGDRAAFRVWTGESSGAGDSAPTYAIGLTVPTTAELPGCSASLVGQVAYVQSPPTLWSCSTSRKGYAWSQIACGASNVGALAYANLSSLMLACINGQWIQVSLPQGPQGEAGPAGADGSSCSVTDKGDGTKTIACDDGSSVTVSDGATSAGSDGLLVTVTSVGGQSLCPSGRAEQIAIGQDLDGDGTPDESEVTQTLSACSSDKCALGSGQACACGGTIQCDGSCSSVVPPDYGRSCNRCGGTVPSAPSRYVLPLVSLMASLTTFQLSTTSP